VEGHHTDSGGVFEPGLPAA